MLGLRPDGLRGLRAEQAILSFLLLPPVTAFAAILFDESKSRALRLDAFQKEVAPNPGSLYRASSPRSHGIWSKIKWN